MNLNFVLYKVLRRNYSSLVVVWLVKKMKKKNVDLGFVFFFVEFYSLCIVLFFKICLVLRFDFLSIFLYFYFF